MFHVYYYQRLFFRYRVLLNPLVQHICLCDANEKVQQRLAWWDEVGDVSDQVDQ